MLNDKSRTTRQHCLTAIKTKIDAAYPNAPPVALFFFEPMQPHGRNGHADMESHALLARQLELSFKNLLP